MTDIKPPDDHAVEIFSLWLRRGWNDPAMILQRIERYARLTLGPVEHADSDQAHYGPCNNTVYVDGTNVIQTP